MLTSDIKLIGFAKSYSFEQQTYSSQASPARGLPKCSHPFDELVDDRAKRGYGVHKASVLSIDDSEIIAPLHTESVSVVNWRTRVLDVGLVVRGQRTDFGVHCESRSWTHIEDEPIGSATNAHSWASLADTMALRHLHLIEASLTDDRPTTFGLIVRRSSGDRGFSAWADAERPYKDGERMITSPVWSIPSEQFPAQLHRNGIDYLDVDDSEDGQEIYSYLLCGLVASRARHLAHRTESRMANLLERRPTLSARELTREVHSLQEEAILAIGSARAAGFVSHASLLDTIYHSSDRLIMSPNEMSYFESIPALLDGYSSSALAAAVDEAQVRFSRYGVLFAIISVIYSLGAAFEVFGKTSGEWLAFFLVNSGVAVAAMIGLQLHSHYRRG